MKRVLPVLVRFARWFFNAPDRKRCVICDARDIKFGCNRKQCPYLTAEEDAWMQIR